MCLFVCSFVGTSVPFMELFQSLCSSNSSEVYLANHSFRKHSYLDNRYPGGLAFIP